MNYPINRPITNAHRLSAWEARKMAAAKKLNRKLHERITPRDFAVEIASLLAFVALMGAMLWIM